MKVKVSDLRSIVTEALKKPVLTPEQKQVEDALAYKEYKRGPAKKADDNTEVLIDHLLETGQVKVKKIPSWVHDRESVARDDIFDELQDWLEKWAEAKPNVERRSVFMKTLQEAFPGFRVVDTNDDEGDEDFTDINKPSYNFCIKSVRSSKSLTFNGFYQGLKGQWVYYVRLNGKVREINTGLFYGTWLTQHFKEWIEKAVRPIVKKHFKGDS